MTWTKTQKVGDTSAGERVLYISKNGLHFYSSLTAYDSLSGLYCWMVEKRLLSNGAMIKHWPEFLNPGSVNEIPLCTVSDGTYMYVGISCIGGTPETRIEGRTTPGPGAWIYSDATPLHWFVDYNGCDVDGSYVYFCGTHRFNYEWGVQALNLTTGALIWEKLVWSGIGGTDGCEATDLAVYGGDVYTCGMISYAVFDDRLRVESRSNVDGSLNWENEEAVTSTYYAYNHIAVDSTGVYAITRADPMGAQLTSKLTSFALSDGAVQWSVTVTAPLTAPGMGGMYDPQRLMILGSKLYICYKYFDPFDPLIPGDINCVESRNIATGALLARDTWSSTITTQNIYGMTGISNAPAADDIVVGGSIDLGGADMACYWEDFLASLTPVPTGPTMDLIMRHCKWFNAGSFTGMYLGWR